MQDMQLLIHYMRSNRKPEKTERLSILGKRIKMYTGNFGIKLAISCFKIGKRKHFHVHGQIELQGQRPMLYSNAALNFYNFIVSYFIYLAPIMKQILSNDPLDLANIIKF